MIKRVCDQHQLVKHSLNFILKKSLSKTDLPSRSYVNCIFVNLQNLGTLGVEQFPNRTSNNFFLRSIFLSSMSVSIKKKVSQNRTKLQQTTTTTTTNDQFPNRTSNNFFLRSIFLSSMSASIKKKVSQNRTKLQQTTTTTTTNDHFFCQK